MVDIDIASKLDSVLKIGFPERANQLMAEVGKKEGIFFISQPQKLRQTDRCDVNNNRHKPVNLNLADRLLRHRQRQTAAVALDFQIQQVRVKIDTALPLFAHWRGAWFSMRIALTLLDGNR